MGLNVKSGRLIVDVYAAGFLTGIPSMIVRDGVRAGGVGGCGQRAAVVGLTSILALTTRQSQAGCWAGLALSCSKRSNGPALTGFTIDSPKGAPSYFSVM